MNKMIKTVCGLVLVSGLAFSMSSEAFAEQPNVDFIDVSHHNAEQGLPLAFYQTIKADNVNAVVVKVSEGEYYVDPAASVNIANAKQAGMIVHAYHFARFNSNAAAKAEAQWFDKKAQLVGFDKSKDGYVVVDVEASNLSSDPAKLTEYTNTFVSELKRLGYSKVDLYTGSYFYNNRLQPKSLTIDKPWLAAYPANPQKGKPTANFSNGLGAWQWSEDYKFIGMAGYGQFDVSEDYAGKYTSQTKSSTPDVKHIEVISLVDYMKSKGMDASFANRSRLAAQYGIVGYQGTAAQNLALLSKLKSGVKPAKDNIDNSKLTTNIQKEGTTVKTQTPSKQQSIVPYPGHLIKKGSRGKDVERIQRAVKVTPDGIFGSKTEAAVKAYQRRHGLSADGIVGSKTWTVMF